MTVSVEWTTCLLGVHYGRGEALRSLEVFVGPVRLTWNWGCCHIWKVWDEYKDFDICALCNISRKQDVDVALSPGAKRRGEP